ncbi:hypothetical protein GQ457_12G026780 [Hibiscus cannabinus]
MCCIRAIWLHRNEIIFKGKILNVPQLIFLIKTHLGWWFKAKFSKCTTSIVDLVMDLHVFEPLDFRTSLANVSAPWCPPSTGFIKFNVDGAMKVDVSVGNIGGILRDVSSCSRFTFSLLMGSGSSALAELTCNCVCC